MADNSTILLERIQELEDAIKRHRDAEEHCWLNDDELYQVLKEDRYDNKDTIPCSSKNVFE